MSHSAHSFVPLDPGRVNVLDPDELAFWCREFGCSADALKAAVLEVGSHASAVRERLHPPKEGAPARGA